LSRNSMECLGSMVPVYGYLWCMRLETTFPIMQPDTSNLSLRWVDFPKGAVQFPCLHLSTSILLQRLSSWLSEQSVHLHSIDTSTSGWWNLMMFPYQNYSASFDYPSPAVRYIMLIVKYEFIHSIALQYGL
uniref:Polyprotein n=1 Tax=Anisakis simplex TaxID=6269 RepID=A0A0M3J1M3_ANISI